MKVSTQNSPNELKTPSSAWWLSPLRTMPNVPTRTFPRSRYHRSDMLTPANAGLYSGNRMSSSWRAQKSSPPKKSWERRLAKPPAIPAALSAAASSPSAGCLENLQSPKRKRRKASAKPQPRTMKANCQPAIPRVMMAAMIDRMKTRIEPKIFWIMTPPYGNHATNRLVSIVTLGIGPSNHVPKWAIKS